MSEAAGAGWLLAIDFGTTNTTAAMISPGRVSEPRVLEIDNSRYLPSAVYLGQDGQLVTGRAAARQAAVFPERAERVPKRVLVGGGQAVLAGQAVPAADLAAAVLSRVYAEAVRFHGGNAPDVTVLTHPARWEVTQRRRLREAAARAGIARAALVPEPVAAAWWYARPTAGRTIAVFDLGGGTLDTAVLQATAAGYEIAGPPGGDAALGGEDFDDLLLASVSDLARQRDPAAWAEVFAATDTRARRDQGMVRYEVTTAKESLSDQLTYDLAVPGYDEAFRVTRRDFERLIEPAVSRAVGELGATITAAGCAPGDLAAIYLTGGSSRIPAISERIAAAFGRLPELRDDPKAVVALGALTAFTAAPQAWEVSETTGPGSEDGEDRPSGHGSDGPDDHGDGAGGPDDGTKVLTAPDLPGDDEKTEVLAPLGGTGDGAVTGRFRRRLPAPAGRPGRTSRLGRAAQPGGAPREGRWRPRRALVIAVAVLAVLGATAGIVVTIQPWRQPPVLIPAGLSVASRTTTSLTFSWDAPATGPLPDDYSIEVDDLDGGPEDSTDSSVPGDQTTYTADGLDPHTSYSFRIYAVRGGHPSQSTVISGQTADPTSGTIVAGDDSAQCVDNNDGAAPPPSNAVPPGNKVQLWGCSPGAGNQTWTFNSNGSISVDGGCLDIVGDDVTNGTLIDLWSCNGTAAQQWKLSGGQIVNTPSGMCLDDPDGNTADGTQLDLWQCNQGSNQQWTVH